MAQHCMFLTGRTTQAIGAADRSGSGASGSAAVKRSEIYFLNDRGSKLRTAKPSLTVSFDWSEYIMALGH